MVPPKKVGFILSLCYYTGGVCSGDTALYNERLAPQLQCEETY